MRRLLRTDLGAKRMQQRKGMQNQTKKREIQFFLKVGCRTKFQKDEALQTDGCPEEEARGAPPGRAPAKEPVRVARRGQARLKGQWSKKLLEKEKLLKRDCGSLFIKLVIKS